MRLLAVTEAIPQKNWATIEMRMRNSARCRPMFDSHTAAGAVAPAPAAAV